MVAYTGLYIVNLGVPVLDSSLLQLVESSRVMMTISLWSLSDHIYIWFLDYRTADLWVDSWVSNWYEATGRGRLLEHLTSVLVLLSCQVIFVSWFSHNQSCNVLRRMYNTWHYNTYMVIRLLRPNNRSNTAGSRRTVRDWYRQWLCQCPMFTANPEVNLYRQSMTIVVEWGLLSAIMYWVMGSNAANNGDSQCIN